MPWICRHTDSVQLELIIQVLFIFPAILVALTCLFRTWKYNRTFKPRLEWCLQSLDNDKGQSMQELCAAWDKEVLSTLRATGCTESVLVFEYMVIVGVAFFVELVAWSEQVTSNIVETNVFRVLLYVLFVSYRKAIVKPRPLLSRYLLRVGFILSLLAIGYAVELYNLGVVTTLNEDNNSFYTFGWLIGLLVMPSIHYQIMAVLAAIELHMYLKGRQFRVGRYLLTSSCTRT